MKLMTSYRPVRPPVWASVFTLAGVMLLMALGLWQVERLGEKQEFLTDIQAAYAQKNPPDVTSDDLSHPPIFARRRLSGQWLEREIILGFGQTQAYYGFLRLSISNAPDMIVAVNCGPAACDHDDMTGAVRPYPRPNWFTPDNEPQAGTWLFPVRADFQQLDPAWILADIIFYPEPAHPPPEVSNNHLLYALFWFSMAVVLIGVFLARFVFVCNKSQ
jgi:surfeit locus 1 family protein